jgi:hypothetical protein
LYLLPSVWLVGEKNVAGYASRTIDLHCPISVSSSLSTFLCLAASWTGLFALYVQTQANNLLNSFSRLTPLEKHRCMKKRSLFEIELQKDKSCSIFTLNPSLEQNFEVSLASDSKPYTKKKVSDFPVPSRDVTNQTLPGRELNYSLLGRVWLVVLLTKLSLAGNN